MKNYKPLYIQLKETIIENIKNGEYLQGEKLPSEREMSTIYKINRMTVKKAIDSLVLEGYIYKIKNKGTFVAKKDSDNKIFFGQNTSNNNYGLSAILNSAGINITSKVIESGIMNNIEFFANKLGLNKKEDIYYIYRLRSINDESVAFEQTYVPLKYFPDISNYDFSKVSLYDYMKSKNHYPIDINEIMIAKKPTHPIERIMKINQNDLLFVFEFISKDEQGTIVEYTISNTRSDKASCFYKIDNTVK